MKCLYLSIPEKPEVVVHVCCHPLVLTVYADFFAAKINLKSSAKIHLKKYFSFQKILGGSSHVFHTVYVKFIEKGALEGT